MVSSNDGRIKTTTKHLRNSTYRLYDKWVERRLNKAVLAATEEIKNLIQVIKASKKISPEIQAETDALSAKRDQLSGELEKVRVDLNIHASKQLEMETIRKNLLHFTDVVDKLSLEEKKELMSLILKEVKVSRVNHEKGKAPAEAGAFNTMIRTSWFRVVVTINAMPSLPVTYDELTQKFVFTSKWLPLLDAFRNPTESFKADICSLKKIYLTKIIAGRCKDGLNLQGFTQI